MNIVQNHVFWFGIAAAFILQYLYRMFAARRSAA